MHGATVVIKGLSLISSDKIPRGRMATHIFIGRLLLVGFASATFAHSQVPQPLVPGLRVHGTFHPGSSEWYKVQTVAGDYVSASVHHWGADIRLEIMSLAGD